jgi:hypothetical protein
MKDIVIEKTLRGHKAYVKDKPNITGVGRRPADAVAALHNFIVGERILEEPKLFGYNIEFKKV